MPEFRKKPVVIDAFQWTGGTDQTDYPEWIIDGLKKPWGQPGQSSGGVFWIGCRHQLYFLPTRTGHALIDDHFPGAALINNGIFGLGKNRKQGDNSENKKIAGFLVQCSCSFKGIFKAIQDCIEIYEIQ